MLPGARMTTVGAQGRCNGNGVTKEPGNSRKHLIQMFHCRMEECSSAAKRSTNNQYVCKYIGRINDQSNWSGPFSLVIMTLDYRSRGTWFDSRSGHSTGIFSLEVYFSSYYTKLLTVIGLTTMHAVCHITFMLYPIFIYRKLIL